MASAQIHGALIADWPSFHAESRRAFGFPEFYGATMDAWVDCLSYLRDEDGMSTFRLKPNETLRIRKAGPMLLAAIPYETRPWHLHAISTTEDAARLGEWTKENDDALRLYAAIMDHTVPVSEIERASRG